MADKAATEDKEITPEEAEKQFLGGFESVIPAPTSADVELGGGENAQTIGESDTQSSTQAQPVTAKTDDLDPAVKGLQKRMRKIEGTLGTISDTLQRLATANAQPAKVADNATAGEQAAAEASRLEAIEKTIGEFQELAPLKDELVALREKVSALSTSGASQASVDTAKVDVGRLTAEITELVTLNTRFPDWQQTTAAPEFKSFMLANGPDAAEYDQYRALRDDPRTAAQAEQIVQGWREDHPGWYQDRGRYMFSTKAEDSVAMLERYKGVQEAQSAGQRQSQLRTDRLRRSVVPDGTQANPVTGKSDEDAFNAGFKRGSSKYGVLRR